MNKKLINPEELFEGFPFISSFFGESRPIVTRIGVASLASPATLVEIEAIAKSK